MCILVGKDNKKLIEISCLTDNRQNDGPFLEEERAHAAHLALLLDKDLKVLVDDGDGQEDSSAGADGPHEIGDDGQGADAETAESSRCRDVAVQFVDHRCLSVASHHHLLFFQLLGNVFGGGARHVDPSFGEEGARAQHETNVEDGVDWVFGDVAETLRRRQVVAQTADRVGAGRAASSNISPDAQQIDQKVASEFHGQHLRVTNLTVRWRCQLSFKFQR